MISVLVACDDQLHRWTIAEALAQDELVAEIFTSGEAQAGANAAVEARPDVVILAAPSGTTTVRHARLYKRAIRKNTVLVGLCTARSQAQDYQLAGIRYLVFLGSDTGKTLRRKVRQAYKASQANPDPENHGNQEKREGMTDETV